MILFGAGLPQLAAMAGEAKTYAERLFDFPGVGALDLQAAGQAIANPIREEGAAIAAEALAEIVRVIEGYPYFLQEWGKHTWNQAKGPEISLNDVIEASRTALAALDRNFFRVRFDRLPPPASRHI